VTSGMRRFLQRISDRALVPGVNLEEFIHALPDSAMPSVYSSLDQPLLTQIADSLKGTEIRRVDIVSPIHGDPRVVVGRIQRMVGDRPVTLYTDSDPEPPRIPGIAEYRVLRKPIDDQAADEPSRIRSVSCVHAKLYAFHLRREVRLFWGSANLSASALLIPGRRSNLDLLVESRLSPVEWNRF